MRVTTSFVCQECGYDTPKFLGKCPECGEWNSLKEIRNSTLRQGFAEESKIQSDLKPKTLAQISSVQKQRLATGFAEADGVFGGGIVPGSATLVAGDPGVGKSTLLLQVGLMLAKRTKVLYISAEESEEQVKLRASRFPNSAESFKKFFLLSLTNTDALASLIQEVKPALVVVDSIQTMESDNAGGLSGSVSQVRYAASVLIRVAKTLRIPLILIGHVTKEGMVAGPMTLSHMVDTVLFLEGEKITSFRILRALKNRFGPVDEVGIFSLGEKGLCEAKNPQHLFLQESRGATPGSILVTTLEGTRAFLVEVQALVLPSKLPMPRRVASGIDLRRLELLLAVVEKHGKLPVSTMDVFVNVAGGFRVSDPAADLGICLAIISSLRNVPTGRLVAIGEVGLLGELREVPYMDKRVKQAKKLGFGKVVSALTHSQLASAVGVLG